MARVTMTEPSVPAPLERDERSRALVDALRPYGVRASRVNHAAQAGLTVTYLYLSEAANGPVATQVLADLGWTDTVIDMLPGGAIAVTTSRG